MIKKILIIIFILIIFLVPSYLYYQNKTTLKKEKEEKIKYIEDIKKHYSKYVVSIKKTNLYDKNKNIIGKINKNIEIELKEKDIKEESDDYFELVNFDNHYIYYKDIEQLNKLKEKDTYYKKYLVYNESCKTKDDTVFYDENFNYIYKINKSYTLPIYIKENGYYGVEFNNKLLYLKSSDVDIINVNNTYKETATSIPVLLYHFFHNHTRFDNMTTVISMRVDRFENQLKYLTENNYMLLKLKDLEMFLDGKIRIPKKSAVITIDDGNNSIYTFAYPLLEKYKVNATVFAVTAWDENVLNRQTDYVEIHSHTHNMHITGRCDGGQGGLFKCIDYEAGLDDLKKSRHILNNTKYLAYPFGEYTDLSLKLLRDSGYTMAFTTNYGRVKVGTNKYLIPRIYMYNEYSLNQFKRIIG